MHYLDQCEVKICLTMQTPCKHPQDCWILGNGNLSRIGQLSVSLISSVHGMWFTRKVSTTREWCPCESLLVCHSQGLQDFLGVLFQSCTTSICLHVPMHHNVIYAIKDDIIIIIIVHIDIIFLVSNKLEDVVSSLRILGNNIVNQGYSQLLHMTHY